MSFGSPFDEPIVMPIGTIRHTLQRVTHKLSAHIGTFTFAAVAAALSYWGARGEECGTLALAMMEVSL